MTDRITSYTRDGLTFEVLDEGPLDGEVVVLLHGFPQLNTMWDKITPGLHAAGYRTLAPNQRGYSPGARPKGRRPYRITHLVDDVMALVDLVGAPVHLVAHDWGAAVGWAAVSWHPERFRSHVAISVPHPGAFLRAMPRGQAVKSWYMAMFNIPVLPELFLTRSSAKSFLQRFSGLSDEAFAGYEEDFRSDRARLTGGLAWYRALVLEDLRKLFVKTTVPTTYAWSPGDVALGRAGADLCEQYVDGDYRLEVLDGSHWLPEEAPEALTRIVLERISAS